MNLSTASPSHTSGLGQTFGKLKFRGAKPSVSWPIIEVLRVVMAALAGHEGVGTGMKKFQDILVTSA